MKVGGKLTQVILEWITCPMPTSYIKDATTEGAAVDFAGKLGEYLGVDVRTVTAGSWDFEIANICQTARADGTQLRNIEMTLVHLETKPSNRTSRKRNMESNTARNHTYFVRTHAQEPQFRTNVDNTLLGSYRVNIL